MAMVQGVIDSRESDGQGKSTSGVKKSYITLAIYKEDEQKICVEELWTFTLVGLVLKKNG